MTWLQELLKVRTKEGVVGVGRRLKVTIERRLERLAIDRGRGRLPRSLELGGAIVDDGGHGGVGRFDRHLYGRRITRGVHN
jgi:hypothetical protein